jgi:hypothetical protein
LSGQINASKICIKGKKSENIETKTLNVKISIPLSEHNFIPVENPDDQKSAKLSAFTIRKGKKKKVLFGRNPESICRVLPGVL